MIPEIVCGRDKRLGGGGTAAFASAPFPHLAGYDRTEI